MEGVEPRSRKGAHMSNRLTQRVLAAVALVTVGGCYQDDFSGPPRGLPLVRVSLTDTPFPYDSVASVNIYVVRIEANAVGDTSGGGRWVLIAEPRKSFDLLTVQQGGTAFVGAGALPAGQYHAVRMTIDTSLSLIVWSGGSKAPVNWQNTSGSNEMPLYAFVESAVAVPPDGAEIVIDFDVGRSFLYGYYGTKTFTFVPLLRAINSTAAGAIAGTVTSAYTGQTRPLKDAAVTVCPGDPCPSTTGGNIIATGRTDAAGHYKVAFLRAGTYTVRIEDADLPFLLPVITPVVQVSVGDTTMLSVSLPQAGSGGAYVHISGPTSVGVGGTIILRAAVGDANGNPVPNPSVTWTSAAPAIASVTGASDTAVVTGKQLGGVLITATSGGLSDSHWIDVASSAPVATVTVVPGSASLTVGDTLRFSAQLRDSTGTVLFRPVSWFTTDSSVFVIAAGPGALVQARGPGSALLKATSEGKTGQATITVVPLAPVATVTVVPGSATLTVGDSADFTTELRDSAGNVLTNRVVSWSSSDSAVVVIASASGSSARIRARGAGTASLHATSEGKTGQAAITVTQPAPVATVTIVPDSANLAVGDSVYFRADLRDAAGNLLTNRTVSWATTDSTVINLHGFGTQALVQPRAVGTAILSATSEGKTGQAKITVH
jgi:uncharacterized protein YjdB